MFEKYRARREASRQAKEQELAADAAASELSAWQSERDGVAELLGLATADGFVPDGLVLHRGEECVGTVSECSLIEERKGQGHFIAGSQGISIPIGSLGGRSVRYRVGRTKGHYVQGEPTPTAIATGTLYLTNQRLAFLSTTQTRECRFDKLVGIDRDDEHGMLTVSVANRQKPTVLSYGSAIAGWVDFRLDLALARWRGDTDELVARLNEQLAEIDAARPGPVEPSPPTPTEAPASKVARTVPPIGPPDLPTQAADEPGAAPDEGSLPQG